MSLTKEEISEIIEASIKANISLLVTKLDNIQGTLNMFYKDLDEDRKGIAEMRTSQATVERLAKEIIDMYSNIVRRVGQKAEEKTEEAINRSSEAVAGLVEPALRKAAKNISNGKPMKIKKQWWKFW